MSSDNPQTTMACRTCDTDGNCTFECRPELPLEDRQRMAGMSAMLREGLGDLVGQRVTPALVASVTARVGARLTILDQLCEQERDDV